MSLGECISQAISSHLSHLMQTTCPTPVTTQTVDPEHQASHKSSDTIPSNDDIEPSTSSSKGPTTGTALSGLYIAANLLVAECFETRRATACSFIFTAGGFNTVVFPPLIEVLYSRYGIHEEFSLYGAILMNAFPFYIALRDPPCDIVARGLSGVIIDSKILSLEPVMLLGSLFAGYFRDRHGSYSGLLHSTAVVNGLLAIIWTLRLLNGNKEVSPTKVDQSSEEIGKEGGTELLGPGRTAATDGGQ
ncbi:hypothetical protein HPB49_005663 [Dermacentor silvarum]|uniref:Uncharacterized protein n=1 Tax=Dermacentor silvarum TaxID=543639 RepID=A0ACB8CQ07_DERSI|nr:hypothetical protein HPB49_005663 [Dermacentor silvarum]